MEQLLIKNNFKKNEVEGNKKVRARTVTEKE